MAGMCGGHRPKDTTCVQTGNEICMFCGRYIINNKRNARYVTLTNGTQKYLNIKSIKMRFTWNGKEWLKR